MRALFYALARLLGDANAVKRGPKAVVRRAVRRVAIRKTSNLINKIVRW